LVQLQRPAALADNVSQTYETLPSEDLGACYAYNCTPVTTVSALFTTGHIKKSPVILRRTEKASLWQASMVTGLECGK